MKAATDECCHRSDKMAANVKKNKRQFIDTYPELVENVEVKLLPYVQDLLGQGVATSMAVEEISESTIPRLAFTKGQQLAFEDGFPVMVDVSSDEKMKKDDYEDLLRQYLTEQYSELQATVPRHCLIDTELASGGLKSRVPYGLLNKSPRSFIDRKYYPRKFEFKDPRNIGKDEINDFCQHVYERQQAHGTTDAFRFQKFHDGKDMRQADYGHELREARTAAAATRQNKSRALTKQGKKDKRGNAGLVERQEASTAADDVQDHAAGINVALINRQPWFAIDPVLLEPEGADQHPEINADPTIWQNTHDPLNAAVTINATDEVHATITINAADNQPAAAVTVNATNDRTGEPINHATSIANAVNTQNIAENDHAAVTVNTREIGNAASKKQADGARQLRHRTKRVRHARCDITDDEGPMIAAAGSSAGMIRITETQRMQLFHQGYDAVVSINGPNDGAPRYEVSAAVEHMLDNPEEQARPIRKVYKKRVRNADRQTIEEGQKLGKRSIGTRANPTRRR